MQHQDTSWETSSRWYDQLVGTSGHAYHRDLIIPRSLDLLSLKTGDHLLDVGCGQGVFARALPPGVRYTGVDASPSLINQAKKRSPSHTFIKTDATQPYLVKEKASHLLFLLSLQNMGNPQLAIKEGASQLLEKGKALLILNHPCFRIPRQSSWGIDESKKLQYRRVDRYLTPLEIPIQTHPGQEEAETTISFHFPLETWFKALKDSNLVVREVNEWTSPKKSTGSKAKMENRSREEFPLFLAILAEQLSH